MDIWTVENLIALGQFLIATAALLTSIVSLKAANRASKLSEGEIECQLAILIRDGSTHHIEAMIQRAQYKNAFISSGKFKSDLIKDELFKTYDLKVNYAEEAMLNAYEEACAKYLDNKVHKARFQKSYHRQIANLVENGLFDDKLNKPSSQYKCILRVYNQWFNLEDNSSLRGQ